jgi:hypothetical protein
MCVGTKTRESHNRALGLESGFEGWRQQRKKGTKVHRMAGENTTRMEPE